MTEAFDNGLLLKTAHNLKRSFPVIPSHAVILGSGIGIPDSFKQNASVPMRRVFPYIRTGLEGHPRMLTLAHKDGLHVLFVQGRLHTYEGYTAFEAGLTAGALAMAGIKNIVLTNAAGGIREGLIPGSLMLIEDHINLLGKSPLTAHPGSGRFIDMCGVYDDEWRRKVAEARSLPSGIYAAVPGPQYETPAEVRMLAALGADAVGMSTVPEAIMAHYGGARVLGVSLITNAAAGLSNTCLTHEEVLVRGRDSEAAMKRLIETALLIPL